MATSAIIIEIAEYLICSTTGAIIETGNKEEL